MPSDGNSGKTERCEDNKYLYYLLQAWVISLLEKGYEDEQFLK